MSLYRLHLALFLADQPGRANDAVRLARHESSTRPTSEVRHVLSWALFRAGDHRRAYELVRGGAGTWDARGLYHAAIIAQACGARTESDGLVARALERRYELDPAHERELRSGLTSRLWMPRIVECA